MQLHVTHHHAVQMQNAENETELVPVIVIQDMKAIRLTLNVDAVESVKRTMIVAINWRAYDTNAQILALVFAVPLLFAMLIDMCQLALAHRDLLAIRSCNVVNYQQYHQLVKMISHAARLHVARIQIVAIMPDKQFAHANQDILERRQHVDRSVLSAQNARPTKLALITNAPIHAHTLAESKLFATQQIIIRFAHVQLDILAIHLHNALVYVSLIFLLSVAARAITCR